VFLVRGHLVCYHRRMSEATFSQPYLLTTPSQPARFVNARCVIYEEEQMCTVMLDGVPIARYHRDDVLARDAFIAQALEAGFAQGVELALTFGMHPRTAYRIRDRFLAEGVRGLVRKKRGPKGPRLGAAREAAIRRWSREGHTAYWMAQQLRVSRPTVDRALMRMGLPTRQEAGSQGALLAVGQHEGAGAGDTADDAGAECLSVNGELGSGAAKKRPRRSRGGIKGLSLGVVGRRGHAVEA
jgi:hypothetical protein